MDEIDRVKQVVESKLAMQLTEKVKKVLGKISKSSDLKDIVKATLALVGSKEKGEIFL